MSETAVLTGVSRGIGAALAKCLLDVGWRLHAIGRSLPVGMNAGEVHRNLVFHPCDLTDFRLLTRVAESIAEPVDVLLNNAAVFGHSSYHASDFDPTDMLATLRVNLISPALLAKTLRPRLLEGRRKLIIMFSTGNASLSGNTTGEMLSYRASKSALNQVVRTMAAEWAGDGLTTIALNPGWVRTTMGGPNAPKSIQEAASEIVQLIAGRGTEGLNGQFVNTDGSPLPW